MIKKYLQFIKEAEVVEAETEESLVDDDTEAQSDESETAEEADATKYTELKDEVKSMIEKTIENMGGEFEEFKDKLIKNPEDTKIEGLINDSDVYDFYLKYRMDIDELLNDVKFFDEIPSELNTFGLYEYVINGTERAVSEIVKLLD